MPAKLYSASIFGIEARLVTVEVDVHFGLPKINVVGLPDVLIQEARERIRSAVKNADFRFPNHRITINLSPADWRKEGTGFDLPIALALLMATDQISATAIANHIIIGELQLSGEIQPVHGVLAMADLARQLKRPLIVPAANAAEATLLKGTKVIPVENLSDLTSYLQVGGTLPAYVPKKSKTRRPKTWEAWPSIVGQAQAKRALTIAAAGHHNVLMIGPPGSGKTLLAKGLRELLPPLTETEALAVTTIHSVAGVLNQDHRLLWERPYRQPHHTASVASLVGGGKIPKPGELSLAHRGILFLDEFPEFSRDHVESLRQPLEDGTVTVSRVAGTVRFPAACMLVAAMNPCPCGYLHDPSNRCHCSPALVARYQRRLSGPVLDRFDLFVQVPRVPATDVAAKNLVDDPRASILAARTRQARRLGQSGATNNQLRGKLLDIHAALEAPERLLLHQAMERLQFSMRAYHRILRVSRTIADLAQSPNITTAHLAEALQYRPPLSLSIQ